MDIEREVMDASKKAAAIHRQLPGVLECLRQRPDNEGEMRKPTTSQDDRFTLLLSAECWQDLI